MKSAVIKRSVIVNGRKTSVSLEDVFWDALRDIAEEENTSATQLVGQIDHDRTTCNLSSAIRIFLLDHFKAQRPFRQRLNSSPYPRFLKADDPGAMTALTIAIIRDRLAMTERHVANDNRMVMIQRGLITELETDGHDTTEATALLGRFEDLLASHLAHRDLLLDELKSAEL